MTSKPTSTPSPAPSTGTRETKQRPTRTIKFGSVQIAIWRNLTDDGREVFNATIERLYFDEKTQQWESSHSFGRRDMLEASKAFYEGHTVVSELHEHANRRVPARQPANSRGNAR